VEVHFLMELTMVSENLESETATPDGEADHIT
jgi:hypothetical protein